MMTQAFYTGVSGLKSSQTSIDVTADNIANVSTIGYRGYSVEFASLFEESMTSGREKSVLNNTIGLGSKVQATTMSEHNGTLSITERSSDLAILGDGWFGVQGEEGNMFTRAGDFTFDADSNLVTTGGAFVLGTMGGNISNETLTHELNDIALGNVNSQEALSFPKSLTYPSQPTQNVNFFANLDYEGTEIRTISASAIDSLSNVNHVELEFSKSAIQVAPGAQWDVTAVAKTMDEETIYDAQSGTVSFGDNGELLSTTLSTIDNNGTTININLGEDYSGITATQGAATTGSSSHDGLASGDLLGYDINVNGEVVATFSNGMQSSVGKVAVYHFQNDQGLDRIGSSSYMASSDSGEPIFFQDESGKNILGTGLANYSLENSNVKMEVALTELIILQRSFDSSSKIITTADEMLKKAIDM